MKKYTSIIISSYDVGEFDRIYTMYTRELGMLRAIGRGVRKQTAKLAGHLEPGTLSEVYVARSRGMGQITSAMTLDGFEKMKENFSLLSKNLRIFRFFSNHFSEGEKDEKIFDLLREYLEVSEKTEDQMLANEAFWWKLFDCLGNRPETLKCTNCGALAKGEEIKSFSVEKGGIVCEKCAVQITGIIPITENQIKLLRIFPANPVEKILKVKVSEKDTQGLKRIRKDFMRYIFS